jgi:DNA polymerase-3 subunit epsilon
MIPRIVFLDIETTGLDPEQDQIIEYCAVPWNGFGTVRLDLVRSSAVMPTVPVHPRAAAVNGYTPEKWAARGAQPYKQVDVTGLARVLDGAIVAGSNPSFDKSFVTAEAKRLGFQAPKWSHRTIDTSALAAPLLVTGAIASTGLGALAEYLGVPREGEHTSAGDVVMAIRVFESLCRLYGVV